MHAHTYTSTVFIVTCSTNLKAGVPKANSNRAPEVMTLMHCSPQRDVRPCEEGGCALLRQQPLPPSTVPHRDAARLPAPLTCQDKPESMFSDKPILKGIN